MTPREVHDHLIENKKSLRTRRGHPCPVCEHTDGWCINDQQIGTLCPRSTGIGAYSPNGIPIRFGEYGFLHLANEHAIQPQPRKQPKIEPPSPALVHNKWLKILESNQINIDKDVKRLALMIGVDTKALRRLKIGYGLVNGNRAWLFPERSPDGLFVGISLRLEEPDTEGRTKLFMTGGTRGLVFADDWLKESGPVFIVEGASDTAMALSAGMCAIGRPSNTGGKEMLPVLLKKVGRREIVIVAENDHKRHEDLKPKIRERHNPNCPCCLTCWPGKAGAKQLSLALAKELGRVIPWMFPEGAKDMREWFQNVVVESGYPAKDFKRRWLSAPREGPDGYASS